MRENGLEYLAFGALWPAPCIPYKFIMVYACALLCQMIIIKPHGAWNDRQPVRVCIGLCYRIKAYILNSLAPFG